jgi:hypothetical protein
MSMWATGVLVGVALAAAVTYYFVTRDRVPPIEKRQRALEALRGLAEQPRLTLTPPVPPAEYTTPHIRIVDRAPSEGRPHRRASARRPPARRSPGDLAGKAAQSKGERPTIAICPAAPEPSPSVHATAHEDGPNESVTAGPVPAITENLVASPAVGMNRSHDRTSRSLTSHVRALSAVAAAAAIVVTIAIVVALAQSGRPARPPRAQAAERPVPAPRPAATTATTQSVPTTIPAVTAPMVVRSTSGATVSVRSPSILTMRATGTCWVEVTDATGNTLFSGTLHPGEQQQIGVSAPLVLHLGYTPGIALSVDSSALDLNGLAQTATVDFQIS